MINSNNFNDGSRPVLGDRPDRRATLGVISLSTAVDQPFSGILCSRWPGRCSGSALELPPRLDLHRHQRRDVRRLHLAVRRSWAPPSRHRDAVLGVPIIDRSIIVRRLLRGRSPFSPDRGHIHHRLLDLGLSHAQTVLVIYGICIALAVLAVLPSGTGKIYAFMGLVVLSGLVLFLLNRAETARALEADTYDGPPTA